MFIVRIFEQKNYKQEEQRNGKEVTECMLFSGGCRFVDCYKSISQQESAIDKQESTVVT